MPLGKKALDNRAELEQLVDRFYARVRQDPLIGPVFADVVDWEEHIPKITDFWDSLLFGAGNYHGRPFPPHVPLGLRAEHFERWLSLFRLTVDESWTGLKADEIKTRATNIGRTFLSNLQLLGR